MYYPTIVQPTSATTWPNTYPISVQQPTVPTVYYQMPTATVPSFPSTAVASGSTILEQSAPTVFYQPTSTTVPFTSTLTASLVNHQEQPPTISTTTTTTKTTRILKPTSLPTNGKNSTIKEAKPTTTVIEPTILRTTNVSPQESTITTPSSVVESHKTSIPLQRLESRSASTTSGSTSVSSTSSITTSSVDTNKQAPAPPPILPFQTRPIVPMRRIIHHPYRPPRTPSGYISSDLDYEKQKVYKTDYKYRHYYCCNCFKGRFDLHNRSYACCEWFYGCPLWGLIICGILFLALLVTFFVLLGLQPSINSSRRTQTSETRLLNRTQIIYGFYKYCGYQINATSGTPTTLILCTNTATTTTARIELSSFYTIISAANNYYSSYSSILTFILFIEFTRKTLKH